MATAMVGTTSIASNGAISTAIAADAETFAHVANTSAGTVAGATVLCFGDEQLVAGRAAVAGLAGTGALDTHTMAGTRAERGCARADKRSGAGGASPAGQAVAFAGDATTLVGITALGARGALLALVTVSAGDAEALVVDALTATGTVVVVAEADSLGAVGTVLASNAEALAMMAETLVGALIGAGGVEHLNFTCLAIPAGVTLTVAVVAQAATGAIVLALTDSLTVGTLEADLAETVAE